MDRETEDRTEEKKRTMSTGRAVRITLLNLLAMVVVGALIIVGALYLLDVYTHHGEAVKVPDLSGMTLSEAQTSVRSMDLDLEIVDSIYTEGMAPGVILKTTPGPGSIIKKHRTIFLTTNTTIVEQVVMPAVYDTSRRRAQAALRSAGFVDVTIKMVPGRYNDLAVEVADRQTGQVIQPGTKLPFNTPLVLSITSTSSLDSLYDADTTAVDREVAEALRRIGPAEEPDGEDLPEL